MLQHTKQATRKIAGTRRSSDGGSRASRASLTSEPSASDGTEPREPTERSGGEVQDAWVLLTPEQAADLLQVRPSWLRRKAAARAVPCRYLGKHLRFTRSDLVAIAEQSAAGTRGRERGVPRSGDLR